MRLKAGTWLRLSPINRLNLIEAYADYWKERWAKEKTGPVTDLSQA